MIKLSFSILSVSLLLASSFGAFADEVVKTFPAGGAKDVLANPHNPTTGNQDVNTHGGGAIKMKRQCTTRDGKITFQGDSAYEACTKEKLEKPQH